MFYKIKQDRSETSSFTDRQQRFYTFLKEYPVGVLSTVTPDGEPHGVVIYFDVAKDFTLSFITRAETKKHDNLKRNPHVMLTVFEPATQATVQIVGTAREIADSYQVNGVAQNILKASLKTSEAGTPPIAKLQAGPFVGYRIVPRQARMAVYGRPDSGEYTDLFESIESFELKHEL